MSPTRSSGGKRGRNALTGRFVGTEPPCLHPPCDCCDLPNNQCVNEPCDGECSPERAAWMAEEDGSD